MRAVRRRLRLYAWLALLSVGALAICPTVSRMLLPGGFVESGAGVIASGSSATPATATLLHGAGAAHIHHHHDGAMHAGTMPVSPHAPSHQHALDHCGFCVLAAHAFAVVFPVPAAVLVSSEGGRRAYDESAPAVPRLRCDWSPATSRGPPLPA